MPQTKPLIFALLLFAAVPLLAQDAEVETGAVIEQGTENRITSITDNVLPAIENMIRSLEAQNAPVPIELNALLKKGADLKTKRDIARFQEKARRYFGEKWEEQLAQDTESLASPETILFVRARTYLSSLIINAEQVAIESPLKTDEIRALGMELIQKARAIEEEGDSEAFFTHFEKAYAQIFPEGDGKDLAAFRGIVTVLLADISDALILLVDGRTIKRMQADLADLQSRLLLVSGSQKLAAWLARFDAFATELLKNTIPAERSVLIQDASALLTNLAMYLQRLAEINVKTGELPEEVSALQEKLSTIKSDAAFEEFLYELELMLTNVTDTYSDSSPLE